ncbi:hypothetical protein ASPCAL14658 [Aspergillus calidoustus]|uniref:Uncharacterized protein n=1 Tax=Aspergillus calidoustus TaxID=454130 RepID=A0A0U4ZQE0_ASPCI|nr:hypothetical protein ASPCAL14658 [Aspergillus calidoustus]
MKPIPSGKEPRLSSPLGGPHRLFDDSFIIEFLQPAVELDATVLMRATYVGDHPSMQLGKKHPQVPPMHLHFMQSESFIVETGAIGTTTTYSLIDTIHTSSANYPQNKVPARLSPPLPVRSDQGVTEITPWTPHQFWPVSPSHPFWLTAEGKSQEASSPQGRRTDTNLLIWGHPRTHDNPPVGGLSTAFPPDLDAAWFVALLSLVDAVHGQRLTMSPGLGAVLMALQTASGASLIIAPKAWWLGPLRWAIPWSAQVVFERARKLFRGKSVVQLVEEVIEREVVRRK